tara:strand:- start:3981 stop:5693 length:1713 start_codon:yes stop_codon:yes gene_type:complete
MIQFKMVKWKNFLSTGNTFTEIDLNRNKTTLVVGHNGAGKSTMLDAISFALFGKPHRNINKPQLINSINNKDCVVEVQFDVGKSSFKVIRGIRPGIFEIWKNGTMINQSSHAKEYQKILEQNILKLNHKSFHQVVVLGSSSFIPFMQLAGGHRRDVIEDLLDINVFSKMNHLLKEKQTVLRDSLKDLNYKIDIQSNKIQTQEKYIRDIKAVTDDNKKEYELKIAESQENIKKLQEDNNTLSEGLDDAIKANEEKLKKLHDRRQVLLLDSQDVRTRMSSVAKRAKFYETNVYCPECSGEISDDLRANQLSECKTEAKSLKSTSKSLGEEGMVLENQIQEITDIAKELRVKLNTLADNNKDISSLQKSITEYQKFIDKEVAADLTEAKNDCEGMRKERESFVERKFEISEQFNYNSVMGEMLKDTGIKTKLIKQYLPAINKLTNQYLQVLDFFVHFNLDESFQETIRSRHRDAFTYDSFSEGEKQRIDLALLFTWRQIAKMKNSVATNLLILDETFDSSLDHDGVENLLKILYTLDDDTNVFVISHKGEILDGKFEAKIEFKKERNFSKMAA